MTTPQPTPAQLKGAFSAVAAVAEAIREAKEIPSGTLYAILCGKMDFEAYERLIRLLKNTGLVIERNYLLIWAGPELEP